MPERLNAATESLKAASATAALKTAPPVVVSGMGLAGYPISEWVTLLTAVFVLLQIGLLLPKYFSYLKKLKKKNDPK